MRVAISSQNFRTITSHAGKTRRFLLYSIGSDGTIAEPQRLELPKGMSLHETHGPNHPLFELGIDLMLTGSAGERFVERMRAHGIEVRQTSETEIASALAAIAEGRALPPAAPHSH